MHETIVKYIIRRVLSKELTKTGPNFPYFLELLKEFCLLKGTIIIVSKFKPYYRSNA